MLLEVKNIRVHYAKAEALKDISINLEEGEIITLIGANGTGKTTILRAISGLVKLTSGEIWYQGKRIDGIPPYKIVKMGISHVQENRRILAPLTVIENLEIGAYLQKNNKEISNSLKNIYEHFPILAKRKNQKAGSLSGGEQQMLAIARALMNKPKLLLLDEPSLGLSPIMVEEVGRIIENIKKDAISLVLVEQNAFMGLKLANRAYIIRTGTILLEGDAKKLAMDERVKKAYLGG